MVMKKATLKRVNYTQEVGASGSRMAAGQTKAAAPTKDTGLPSSGQAKVLTAQETGALIAEKAADKRVAVASEETARKVSEKKKEKKKRASEGVPDKQKKKARVEEARESKVEVEIGEAEDSVAYDLTFAYNSREHIRDNLQASADLLSRIPCHDDLEFPELDDLAEKDAY